MAHRTWHDVVDELTMDPTTGRRRYGSLTAIVKATGIARSTFDTTLREKTSPRNEIEVVRKIADALGIDPMRLFCPDAKPGADKELAGLNMVWYAMLPADRQKLVRALSDPDTVNYLLGCLDGYQRARSEVRTIRQASTGTAHGRRTK